MEAKCLAFARDDKSIRVKIGGTHFVMRHTLFLGLHLELVAAAVSSFAQLLDFHKDDKGQKMTTSPCLWQAMSSELQVLGPIWRVSIYIC